MLTLPHTLVAVAIVKLIPNPLISLPLCLTSHFFLDFLITHWNPHLYTEYQKNGRVSSGSIFFITIDALLALTVSLAILLKFWPNLSTIGLYATGIFLATLPDTIEIPYYFMGVKSKLLSSYVEFEHKHQANGSVLWGIITQIITVTLSLLVLLS